jgi:phage protein D
MLNPAYKLTIGSKVVDTTDKPQASTVVDLTVSLDLDTPADSFTLVLGQVGGLKPGRDDKAQVELGYADDSGLTQVISGVVDAVEPSLTTTRIVGFNAAPLLRTFVDQTYEGKTAGEIVGDLASHAGIDVDTSDDGINFPAYVVDGRRSVHYHMLDLAALCGFDLYITSEGKLVFQKFANGNTVHVLEYARHVIELDIRQLPPLAAQVTSWGESPGSGHGDNAWAWLTKDFSGLKGAAGSGSPTLVLEDPALRTSDASASAADAAETVIRRRRIRGRVLVLGDPSIALGDVVQFKGLPDSSLDGSYQVRAVTHRITKTRGFTTAVQFRAISQ